MRTFACVFVISIIQILVNENIIHMESIPWPILFLLSMGLFISFAQDLNEFTRK